MHMVDVQWAVTKVLARACHWQRINIGATRITLITSEFLTIIFAQIRFYSRFIMEFALFVVFIFLLAITA